MNIIECVVFSVRLSSDTPFCSSVPTVRESRSNDAPSGERNSTKSAFFYICIHLSRCCYSCIGRVWQHRLLTASVSNGGPLLVFLPLCVFPRSILFRSPQKNPRFLSLRAISRPTQQKVIFEEWTCMDEQCNGESLLSSSERSLGSFGVAGPSQMPARWMDFDMACFFAFRMALAWLASQCISSGSVEADCLLSYFYAYHFLRIHGGFGTLSPALDEWLALRHLGFSHGSSLGGRKGAWDSRGCEKESLLTLFQCYLKSISIHYCRFKGKALSRWIVLRTWRVE